MSARGERFGHEYVSERPGRLRVIEPGPGGRLELRAEPVAGVPAVLARGQAGLFDVVADPSFSTSGEVLLSFAHGTPEVVAERLAAHLDAGADEVAIQLLTPSPDDDLRPLLATLAGALAGYDA